ncbi:MAG: hypothetical protein ACR2QT_09740 [Woeseiaceae bacterium]
MTHDLLTRYWALIIASILGTAILLFVLYRLYEASRLGQLNAGVRQLRRSKHEAAKARRRAEKAAARLAHLQSRAASIKPRLLSEADEAVQDANALQKIADDQVLVAIKQVREVILEEFPPNRQDVLRNKYL